MESTKAEIQNYINEKLFVKVLRFVADDEMSLGGFILQQSDDFLLIQVEEEFLLNGYAIIRTEDIDEVICEDGENMIQEILEGEEIVKKSYGIDHELKMKSWKTIFKNLQELDFHVSVECEDLDEPTFIIGPIEKIGKEKLHVRYYSPSAILEKETTKINLEDITLIKFGDRYSTIYRKYLKEA
jgi:hypothetical protein